MNSSKSYEDIINLPHHTSERHPRMAPIDRAAQFSPFAALTGHGAAINETARLTTRKIELDEDAKALLDSKLRILTEMPEAQPQISVTYFVYDKMKFGGEYVKASGKLKGINEYKRIMYLTNGDKIDVDDILEIESDMLLGIIN